MADCAFRKRRMACINSTPRTFSACAAVTFRGATDARFPDPRKIATALHVSWGHASAHQSRRVMVGPDGEPVGVVTYVQSFGQCEIRCAIEKVPHIPATSAVSIVNGQLQAACAHRARKTPKSYGASSAARGSPFFEASYGVPVSGSGREPLTSWSKR